MEQILLPIKFDDSYNTHDFIVSGCNVEAYNAVSKENVVWPSNRLLVLGEEGSGKTHLLKVWQDLVGARQINSSSDVDITSGINLVIDDISKWGTERELLHAINIAEERQVKLLMTNTDFQEWTLPDLRSRLNSTYKIIIKSPDETFIPILLHKMFSDQQLFVQQDVLNYISVRIERSFTSIKRFFQCLNRASMLDKRNITIPFAKSILLNSQLSC